MKGYKRTNLDRLLNRVNTSVRRDGRFAYPVFDDGGERMVRRRYGRLRDRNHVPGRACAVLDTGYEMWEDDEPTKNIPIERVIGGPSFRDSASDHLLQVTGLIAYALLKQEEQPSPEPART